MEEIIGMERGMEVPPSLGGMEEHDQTQEVPPQCGDNPVPAAVDTHWTWL